MKRETLPPDDERRIGGCTVIAVLCLLALGASVRMSVRLMPPGV